MSTYICSEVAPSNLYKLLAIELEAESLNAATFAMHPGFTWSRMGTCDGEVDNTQMQHPAMQELFNMFGSMGPKSHTNADT